MAYSHPYHIANGLALDFTVQGADTANDGILGVNSIGELTKFSSIPGSRISAGGNLTEATSAVLTITGGTAAVLTSGLTIQVKQAGAGQSGYLSSTDWNTFNNKISPSLTSGHILVGNVSNAPTDVAMTGDIGITNAGVTSISAGVIVNADVHASAGIAVSKLAALTASLMVATNGSGFLTTVAGFTPTIAGYLTGITSPAQAQIDGKLSVTLSGVASGDFISFNGSAWVNVTAPAGSMPTGGSSNQVLRKINGTNYNTEWHSLAVADLTDLTTSAAVLNQLTGVTTTTAQFNYINTLSSNAQTQLNSKLGNSLAQNAMFYGNVSNVATALPPGPDTYVLTSSSGVPTWAPSASVALTNGNGTTANGTAVDLGGTVTAPIVISGAFDFSLGVANIDFGGSGNVDITAGGTMTLTASVLELNVPSTKIDGYVSIIQNSPSQITSNQNDYAPGNYSSLRISTDASRNITGISGGTDGRLLTISNVGSFNAVLKNQDIASSAGNRFLFGSSSDVILTPNASIFLQYDNTTANWRDISSVLTNSAANTELMMSNGANAVPSGLFSTVGASQADLSLGSASIGGSNRTIKALGSGSNIDFILQNKGNAAFSFNTTSGSAILTAGGVATVIQFAVDIYLAAKNIGTDTVTGTKLGTATSQRWGIWNAAPIVQPTTAIAAATFVANSSGIADDTATWDGYTNGQVVKALRNFGFLA